MAEPHTGASGNGDLFSDLWVLMRDLDPSDGGGNGEPILDVNGQVILIGYDPVTGATFPIHLVEGEEGEYDVPADQLQYVQEIELERANVIRSPDEVKEQALAEALAKIEAGTIISVEATGRIIVDGVLIDSPRENIALYDLIMKNGGATSWTEAQANAATNLPQKLVDLLASGWDPTGLLAGGFSKFTPVTLDAVITAHTLMSVNGVTGSGDTQQIDHYGFTNGVDETFDYDRVATYGDVWVQWYQDMDGDPTDLEAVQRTLLDAAWGTDRNGDGVNDVGSGVDWADEYIKLSDDGASFETVAATGAGINDWAQSVEDARAAILVLHEYIGAGEIAAPPISDDRLVGSNVADYIAAWGGDDVVIGGAGDDILEGGDGNDKLRGDGGDDRLDGGAGDDRLIGGLGDDRLVGGSGNDTLDGGDGKDWLSGGSGSDALSGGAGKDKLIGHRGVDTLDGGDGNDRLIGGRGDDFLSGGDGADNFIFASADAIGTDTITDFSRAEFDVISLNRIDAIPTTVEDDAFTFIGYVAFSGAAGEVRGVDLVGTQRIEGDVDGDGVADFAIEIVGATQAEADWFVL